jgi:glycerol-3-phosphate acyltransferase PlsY
MLLPLIVTVVACYLLGSLSGSLLVGKLRGVDIREQGSGNAGGTNAFRTQGWRFALAVVVIDVGKGALAAWLGTRVVGAPAPFDSTMATAEACGFAAIVGHCWPVFFGFRGGKGAGTAAGAILVLAPLLVLPVLGAWLLVLISTGYVGLSTVVAALVFAAAGIWRLVAAGDPVIAVFAIACAVLIVFMHRGNLARLAHGTEHRFERARLLHRR